jgi:nickel-dependent lactate racemase
MELKTREFGVPFGRGHLKIQIAGDLIAPRTPAAAIDERKAIEEAIENPIGRPPLRAIVKPGERVAIVINDVTRLCRSDLMLPPIVDALNSAGIPDNSIFIVFALGIHREQTEAERRQIAGDEIYGRFRMFDHVSTDKDNLVYVGTTSFGNRVEINKEVWEADRIILTGEIIYHLIAGYSGGRKSLVPGVAGFATTTFNHRMIFDPRCRAGLLEGNPAHEDLLEACRLVDPDFIVNLVLTPDGKLAHVVAGHYDLAHREGCRAVDQMMRVQTQQPYDLIVASAGGFPLDIDLRQAHKPLENACQALRPGGSILFYAECPNGAGIRSFEEYVYRFADHEEMRRALEDDFVVGGHKAYWIARLGRLYDVHLVSTLDPLFVKRCHLKHVPVEEHEAMLSRLVSDTGTEARVAVIPHAAFTLPARQVDSNFPR